MSRQRVTAKSETRHPCPSHLHIKAQCLGDGKDVLVTAATHVHADDMILGQLRCDLHHMRQGVGRFQCRDNPLERAA